LNGNSEEPATCRSFLNTHRPDATLTRQIILSFKTAASRIGEGSRRRLRKRNKRVRSNEMSIELDEALGRLATAPPHPGLTGLEDRVFARVREQSAFAAQASHRMRIGAVAAIAALGLGLAAGSPVAASASTDVLSPFAPASPLAPSTLLVGDQ